MNESPPLGQETSCWDCGQDIAAQDHYCRHCGKGQGVYTPWYYHHWGIILCTLFALGPFGLILVWRSPRLTNTARWAYTAIIALLTATLSWQLYRAWIIIRSAIMSAAAQGIQVY